LNLSAFPAADNREDQVTVPESALNSLAAALASGHFDHNRAYRQEAWRCEASTHQRLDETVDRIKKGSFKIGPRRIHFVTSLLHSNPLEAANRCSIR
jgi:hypothetical protein